MMAFFHGVCVHVSCCIDGLGTCDQEEDAVSDRVFGGGAACFEEAFVGGSRVLIRA